MPCLWRLHIQSLQKLQEKLRVPDIQHAMSNEMCGNEMHLASSTWLRHVSYWYCIQALRYAGMHLCWRASAAPC